MHNLRFCSLIFCITPVLAFAADGESESATTSEEELQDILQGFESDTSTNSDLDVIMEGFEDTTPSDDEIDSIMEGFEDSTQPAETAVVTIEPPKPWDLLTLISLSSSYNIQHEKPADNQTDYRGLSRLKLKVQPEFRYQFNSNWDSIVSASAFYDAAYHINGRDNYTDQVLDSYESEFEFRDTFIRGTISSDFDVSIGRQIVVWGKADSIRTIDVLNPLDFREPGMVDIEDLRLPVFMLKGDYYFSDWNLSAMIIPEIRITKYPAYGSDFYLGDPNAGPPDENIPDDFSNQEFGLALKGRFQGWDLSFHYANVFDDQAYATMENNTVTLHYPRINLYGIATNIASGNWIIKAESAIVDGLRYSEQLSDFTRADVMLGLDYAGITNTTLSIEGVNRHILDYDKTLEDLPQAVEENEGQIFFRYTATFMREKLEATGLISLLGLNKDEGAFYRGSLQYELQDAMTIQVGAIVYEGGDSRISQVAARNDRLFMDWRYTF